MSNAIVMLLINDDESVAGNKKAAKPALIAPAIMPKATLTQ